MSRRNLDTFTRAYIEAALWSTNDESDEQGGEPLDANYGPGDIAPETMELIVEDCADFQKRFGNLIEDDDSPRIEKEGRWELAGYHFWLTREGHGSGFWDGDWPKHGDELTNAAKEYGPFELYVGDDRQIYGPPPDQYRHPPEWLAKRHPSRGRGGRSEEGHSVADFTRFPEIVEHAMRVDGATHVLIGSAARARAGHARLYFPIGGGKYEEAKIWHERGYWHSEAANARSVVDRLPAGAQPIEIYLAPGRSAVSERVVQERAQVPARTFRSHGGRTFTVGPVQSTHPHYEGDPHWSDLYPILYNGQPAGKLFRSASYGPDKPWSATTRELYWKYAPGVSGIGFDVAAFSTPQEALEAWGRSADQILDWHEGKGKKSGGRKPQRTSSRRR